MSLKTIVYSLKMKILRILDVQRKFQEHSTTRLLGLHFNTSTSYILQDWMSQQIECQWYGPRPFLNSIPLILKYVWRMDITTTLTIQNHDCSWDHKFVLMKKCFSSLSRKEFSADLAKVRSSDRCPKQQENGMYTTMHLSRIIFCSHQFGLEV